jgi:hypothetical protein
MKLADLHLAWPAAASRVLGGGPWARWLAPAAPRAITAVMAGDPWLLARVERGAAGRLRLAAVEAAGAQDLARWPAQGHFRQALPLLVLRAADRHLLSTDRPEVPDHELAMALRWPLAEALEVEPEQLLATALRLPSINEAARPQVLGIGARLATVRAQMAALARAGVAVRSIDIEDSALRGLRALREPDADGGVVLSMIGGNVAIGLIWKGEFCALRTLALPVRAPRDSDEFEEHLALHIQRTVDLFERQARQLSIRQVVASLPTLREQALQTLQGALPMPTHRFELEQAFDLADGVEALCHAHGDLVALAAVAAARLLDRDAATQATMAAASPQRAAEVAA